MDNETQATPSSDTQGNASAETGNTDRQEGREVNYVPQSRVTQLANEKRALEARLAELERAEAERLEKERLALGKHEEVIADLRPKAQRVTELEETLQSYLNAELETTPDHFKAIIPENLDVAAKLRMVQQARLNGLFNPPTAPKTDAGVVGDGGPRKQDIQLTPDEEAFRKKLNLSIETYAKRKAEIEGTNVNDDQKEK